MHKNYHLSFFWTNEFFFTPAWKKVLPAAQKSSRACEVQTVYHINGFFWAGAQHVDFLLSLSHSLSHWIYHTLSLSLSLTRSHALSYSLSKFNWNNSRFEKEKHFSQRLIFSHSLLSFFLPNKRFHSNQLLMPLTVVAVSRNGSKPNKREKKNYCPCQIPILSICDDWAQLSTLPPS